MPIPDVTPDPCTLIVTARTILIGRMPTQAAILLMEEALRIGASMGMRHTEAPCNYIVSAVSRAQQHNDPAGAVDFLFRALTIARSMGLYQPDRLESVELDMWDLRRR